MYGMEITTPGTDLISRTAWTVSSVFDFQEDEFSFWTLSGFNISNASDSGIYGGDADDGRVSGRPEGEVKVPEWYDLWRGIPLGIVLALLCSVTTVGNIMVLHAVRTEKRLQTVSPLLTILFYVPLFRSVHIYVFYMPVSFI